MPKPPPRSSSGSATPSSADDPRVQRQHPAGGDLEARRCRRSASRCGSAGRAARGPAPRSTRRTASQRVAAGDREAELLVLVGGGDVLVGVRLDAGGHPHHHPRRCGRARAATAAEPLDLVEGVDDDPADAELDARARSSATVLLLPWKPIRAGSKPARSGDGQLAAGADVEAEPLLGDPARDRRAQERLAGVVDVVAGERVAEGARPGPEVGLVEDVRRGAVLGDQVGQRRPRRPRSDAVAPCARSCDHSCGDQRVDVGGLRAARTGRGGRRRRAPSRPRGRASRSHPLGRGDAEQAEAVGEHDPGGVDEQQPRPVQVGAAPRRPSAAPGRCRRTGGTTPAVSSR